MKVIWKYEIPTESFWNKFPRGEFQLEIPEESTVLCVQTQNDRPHLWAKVETDKPLEIRNFYVVGTGCCFPEEANFYVGTWQNNSFVWHLFSEES